MVADKPIKISGKTKQELDGLKIYVRETYDDVISRLVKPVDTDSEGEKEVK